MKKKLYTSIKIVPKSLEFQFEPDYAKSHNFSDKCCLLFKKGVLREYEAKSGRVNSITGMRQEEGGNRDKLTCITSGVNGKHFNFLAPINEEWEEWFIKKYDIKLCELYYSPYNFNRTGCLFCPYSLNLQEQLDKMKQIDKATYKQACLLWKPVFDEYKRIDYRLKNIRQMDIWDLE